MVVHVCDVLNLFFKKQTTKPTNSCIAQVAQLLTNLPANAGGAETQVWSLGQEDLPEEEMATCSSILAWEIPWTEEPGGLPSMGL